MLQAAFGFAGGVGDDALGFGLTDAFAGVGFDGLDGGKGLFFGAFFRHLCLRRLQIHGFLGAFGRNLPVPRKEMTYKLALLTRVNVKYFPWNLWIGVRANGRTRIFR